MRDFWKNMFFEVEWIGRLCRSYVVEFSIVVGDNMGEFLVKNVEWIK